MLQASYDLLMQRAAALAPEARRRYLGDVPPNRELLQLVETGAQAGLPHRFQ